MPNRSRAGGTIHEWAGPSLEGGGRAIEGGHPGLERRITEHVKWNAPSFCYAGEDRVTFRLYPEDRAQLVFHRGSRVKDDADAFAFDDDTGLLRWVANDRAVVALRDAEARSGTSWAS